MAAQRDRQRDQSRPPRDSGPSADQSRSRQSSAAQRHESRSRTERQSWSQPSDSVDTQRCAWSVPKGPSIDSRESRGGSHEARADSSTSLRTTMAAPKTPSKPQAATTRRTMSITQQPQSSITAETTTSVPEAKRQCIRRRVIQPSWDHPATLIDPTNFSIFGHNSFNLNSKWQDLDLTKECPNPNILAIRIPSHTKWQCLQCNAQL